MQEGETSYLRTTDKPYEDGQELNTQDSMKEGVGSQSHQKEQATTVSRYRRIVDRAYEKVDMCQVDSIPNQ